MNPKVLKEELIQEIRVMPVKDLKTVADFVDFIREKELEEEILNNKGLIRSVKKSQKAWKSGKISEFVAWEELKKKYKI